MKPLLTKKDRTLHPRAQVAKLLRIARRCEAKADWLDSLDYAANRVESGAQRERAIAAADEVIRIVVDNPDAGWTPAQYAYCASQEVER